MRSWLSVSVIVVVETKDILKIFDNEHYILAFYELINWITVKFQYIYDVFDWISKLWSVYYLQKQGLKMILKSCNSLQILIQNSKKVAVLSSYRHTTCLCLLSTYE